MKHKHFKISHSSRTGTKCKTRVGLITLFMHDTYTIETYRPQDLVPIIDAKLSLLPATFKLSETSFALG